MSQKKMEAYKEAKKNVKNIRKKEKRNRVIGYIVGILCAAVLIAGSVFLIYYTNVIKPQQEAAATEDVTEDDDSTAIESITLDGNADATAADDSTE